MRPIYIILFSLLLIQLPAQTNPKTDSLNLLFKKATSDSLRFFYAFELSKEFSPFNIVEARKMMEQALAIAQKNKWKPKIMRAYNGIGNYYAAEGDPEKAIEFHKKSLALALAENGAKEISVAYYGISCDYIRLSNYQQAMEYAYKALPEAEKAGYKQMTFLAYGIIGDVLMRTGKYEKALETQKKLLAMATELGNKNDLLTLVGNIAITYDNMGDAQNALVYYEQQLKMAQESGNVRSEASAWGNMGTVYLKQKDYKKALVYGLKSLELKKRVGSKLGVTSALLNIGSTYFDMGDLKQAEKYALESQVLAHEIKAPDIEVVGLELLSNIAEKQGQFKKALELYRKQVNIRDTLFNLAKEEDLTRRELTYEFGKKAATDSIKAAEEKKILAERNTVQELQLSRSRLTIYSLIIFLILALLIAYLFIRQNKFRTEQYAIRLEQKLLRLQMNPHFIFNCLQAIQNFIEEKKAVQYLSSFGALTRSVLENSRMESIPLDKEVALLRHYLELQKMLHEGQFDYTIYVDPKLDTEDIVIPPMLAQPFIENAIEHGMRTVESGGLIEIRFVTENSCLHLEVKDNGLGLPAEQDPQHRSLATTITRERLELINKGKKKKTTFSISESFPGQEKKGVKVNFSIPV